jgi:hypothetical protein
VHYKFIAFNCCKVFTIPYFGDLVKKIKIASYRRHRAKQEQEEQDTSDEMQFQKRTNFKSRNGGLQAILPLEPIRLPTDDKDKSKFITFELKVRAGAPEGSGKYKRNIRTFEEGTPQDWMDVLVALQEIWKQNSVNGPTDRAATVAAILKGDSLTAFDAALEDARVNPDDNTQDPTTLEHVDLALRAVTTIIFPFRALETQKMWMTRIMRKPYDMPIRTTAAAISRLNNYLPAFPEGTPNSKFSDQELVSMIHWSLPYSWQKTMDSRGFILSTATKAGIIEQGERIERTEEPRNDNNNNNNNNKKAKKHENANSGRGGKKHGGRNVDAADGAAAHKFYCTECGKNPSHNTDRCYILKNLARKAEQAKGNGNGKPKPYSKRTFRKEVNAIARRAGKNDGLVLMAAALKREQKKSEKASKKPAKAAKKAEPSDSESSSDESMNNIETRIPRKKAFTVKSKLKKQAPLTKAADKKSIFEDLLDAMSEDEDMIEVVEPTAEEKAFLKSIDKEEKKLASKQKKSKKDANNEEMTE